MRVFNPAWRERALLVLVTGLIIAAGIVLVEEDGHLIGPGGGALPGLCIFRQLAEIDCPFCGMTRSVVDTLHGDLYGAIASHPAGPFMTLLIGWVLIANLIKLVARPERAPDGPASVRAIAFGAVGAMVAGLVRLLLVLGS